MTTKILHSLWAGFWSSYLLWILLSNFSNVELSLTIPALIAALVWLFFAIGLLFEWQWAWYGCFVISVLSLFVALYVTWTSVVIVYYEGGNFLWESVGAIVAIMVVTTLLHTRHKFLKPKTA
jgi:hypothetical protein